MSYKRLTNNNLEEYDPEYDFCIDCKYFGEPNGCNRPNGTCDNYERFIEIYNRLSELEDKIENGDLISPCDMGYNEIAFFVKHNAKVREDLAKEFAQKIKDGVADYLYKTNFDGRKENVIDIFELCEIVDSTVKEYENEI